MINLGHLDCNVEIACNFRCVSCSHAAPFTKSSQMSPEELARDLANLSKVVHFHRIQMVGGEPTMHRDLPAMMRVARASGIANEVMVITNGKLLPTMGEDFWQTLDTLNLSVYPTLNPSIPEFARAKCAEYGKPFYQTVFNDFYQQLRATPNDGSHFGSCHWKSDCYTVHRGAFYLCPQSAFFPAKFQGLEATVDGLPLDGLTEDKFLAFLNRTEPLNACRVCMANELKSKPWAEAKTKEEWVAGSTA